MKYILGSMILLATMNLQQGFAQRDQLFSDNWRFVRDSVAGAEVPLYDDSQWIKVDVPHDFSLMSLGEDDGSCIGPFTRQSEGGNHTGHVKGGTGWYRKQFILDKSDKGKTVILNFDGVYMETDLWVNGKKVGVHKYGYTPFWFDITSYLNKPGKPNVIAVKVDNMGANSRWYSGSGIYRNVRLSVLHPLHIAEWGAHITTSDVSLDKASVRVEISSDNDTKKAADVELTVMHKDRYGQEVACNTEIVSLQTGNNQFTKHFSLDEPALWSIESPNLYTVEISLKKDDQVVDSYVQSFGIRTIEYSAKNGLLLNDKPVLLKGGCLHHDNGFLGAAAIRRAEYRRVQLMKQNGYNAIRCSHNPPSKEFLDACDQLGVLVINEFADMWECYKNRNDYARFFKEWWRKDLSDMLLRDRNHPCIIMWSIGNEIPAVTADDANRVARQLVAKVHEYDRSRPVTQGVPNFIIPGGWRNADKYFSPLDICGYNYLAYKYEEDHRQFPDRIMYASESYPGEAYESWKKVERLPYVIGDFVWTAMDYIGEVAVSSATYVKEKNNRPGLQDRDGLKEGTHPNKLFDMMNSMATSKWPLYLSWCGDLDIIGNKKPQGLFRDVLWNRSIIEMNVHEPVPEGMIEELSGWGWPNEWPSWDWDGQEGKLMQIRVFTKAPRVRLELNGRLMEEKTVDERMTAIFSIPYEPGELTAIALNNDNEVGRKVLSTPGTPAKVQLCADRTSICADRNDLAFIEMNIIDQNDNIVTNNDQLLEVSITGNGEIVASGNAGQYGMKDVNRLKLHTFRGRAQIVVRPFIQSGKISISVKVAGLPVEHIHITVQ